MLAERYETPLHAEGKLKGINSSSSTDSPGRSLISLLDIFKYYYVSQDTRESQLKAMSHAFSSLASQYGLSVQQDYCEYSVRAMLTLKENGRSNVLYRLARALSTPRSDGKGSKFPTDRMPMGLLEYMVAFFDSETSPQVDQ